MDNYTKEPTKNSTFIMAIDVIISEYNPDKERFNAPFIIDDKFAETKDDAKICEQLGILGKNGGPVYIYKNTPIIECNPFGGGGGCCALKFKVKDHIITVDLCMDFVQTGDDTYELR